MDCKRAREVIKNNYPPESYMELREALDWLLEQAEKIERIEKESDRIILEKTDRILELETKVATLEHMIVLLLKDDEDEDTI